MEECVSRLPSLNALRAFECAARQRSITRAAEELCVTHGAVSRLVQQLEADLKAPLLRRLPRSVEPTPEGARLAEALGTAFSFMHRGVAEFRERPLTLACSSSIMSRWLIPRLAGFRQLHPDVELRLSVSHGAIDFVREDIDVALRNSSVPRPADIVAGSLAREHIGLVCAPDYLLTLAPAPHARAWRILETTSRPDALAHWLQAAGEPVLDIVARESFAHFYLAIQASACGFGATVAPHMLVEDDLASGKLVAPFGFVPGTRELQLWIRRGVAQRPGVQALSRWLEAEVASGLPAAVMPSHRKPGQNSLVGEGASMV
jgi:LysR family glycine cleavage system transcriptional activator